MDVVGSSSHEWHFLLFARKCLCCKYHNVMFDNRLDLLPQPVVTKRSPCVVPSGERFRGKGRCGAFAV